MRKGTVEFVADSVWELRIPRIRFGVGSAQEIGYDVDVLGGTKILVVTDKGVVNAGLLAKIEEPLVRKGLSVSVWDEVEPEPSLESMQNAVDYATGRDINLLVALGGGSSIDTAKVVGLITTHGGKILEYFAPPLGKGKKVPGPCKPLIAIPTTAGTGSETSPAAMISFQDEMVKAGITSDFLRANLAILDPLMTITMPPHITANTGMDALTHAIEAFTARDFDNKPRPATPLERPIYGGATSVTDLLAAKSTHLIGKNLRKAVHQGNNVEARSEMLLAALLAGIAFTNAGLGAVHAASFPIGGRYHASHGLVCALLLPAVMKYNLPSRHEKYAEIARLLGEDTSRLGVKEAAESAIQSVKKLMKDVGMPSGLVDIGVREEDIPELTSAAMKVQRLLVGNPRPVTEKDMIQIIEDAMTNR